MSQTNENNSMFVAMDKAYEKYNVRLNKYRIIYFKNDNYELRIGINSCNDYNDPNFFIQTKKIKEKIFQSETYNLIQEEFPEFVSLIKWDRFSLNNGPINYSLAYTYAIDASFFNKINDIKEAEKYSKWFAQLAILREKEELPALKLLDNESLELYRSRIRKWLDDRLPGLIEDAKEVFIQAGLLEI